ncbi:MAG: hypothetical protein AAF567_08360 [Actinomycetota bacterium]
MSDTTAGTASPQSDERLAYRGVFQRMLVRPEIGAAIGALAIWAIFWAVAVPFGKASGASSILDVAASPLGIMAVAVAMLMIGGEFDLSSGAATGAFGILLILMVRDVVGDSGGWGLSLWTAVPLSLIAALGLGWFNGTVVDRTGLPSFIVTLASFFVLKGAKLGFSKQIVDQIQTGRLDQLLIDADAARIEQLLAIGAASGGAQDALLEDLGVTLTTPVDGLDVGDGSVGALVTAVETASENDNLRQLEELAGVSRSFIDVGDGGYSTLNDVFAYDWLRNEHIWEWRDWLYTIGVLAGLSLIALAVYEMHFRRRPGIGTAGILPFLGGGVVGLAGLATIINALFLVDGDNRVFQVASFLVGVLIAVAGVAVMQRYRDRANGQGVADAVPSLVRASALLPGAAIAVVGVWRLHATDSVGGNWVGALIIAVGMVIGFLGWSRARYEPGGNVDTVVGEGPQGSSYVSPLVIGLGALVVGMVIARWMDSDNDTNLVVEWGINGWAMFFISILVGLAAAGITGLRGDAFASALSAGDTAVSRGLAVLLGTPGMRMRTAGILTFVVTQLFLTQATIQGARAIFFMILLGLAATSMLTAVNRARRSSHTLGSLLLLLTAAGVAAAAFFIRWDSATHKFRTEMFSVLLAVAALMAIWAVITLLHRARSAPDAEADALGRGMAIAGGVLVVFGIGVRLLGVTQAELDGGIGPTNFSVRILWFLGFTALATWVLGRTRFGSWIFAVGGNKEASRQVGVPASRTKTQLFMIVSFAAWLVGLLLAFRLNTIQASTGDGEEFEYIIAAVVGGNALTGGRGSTLGAAIGALIMAMAVQGIPSARWNSDWRFVFVGVILLLAVIANNFIRTQAEQAR